MTRWVHKVVWVRKRGGSLGEFAFRSPAIGRAGPFWRAVVGVGALLAGATIVPLNAAPLLQLKSEALVTGQGVFLPDLVTAQERITH